MGFIFSCGYSHFIASLIDFFILIVALIIAYQSNKIYHFLKENKYKFFSYSFLAIGLGYLFKIFSNFTVAHRIAIISPDFFTAVIKGLDKIQLFHFLSFIIYKFFILIGFLLLLTILLKTNKKGEIALFIYLSIITLLFSIYFDAIYHLTISIILLILTAHFYKNYEKTSSSNSKLVFIAFVLMLVGSIIAALVGFSSANHLIGEIFLLLGFLILFANHIILNNENSKNGKKTNKDRSNKRYIRSAKKK